MYRLIAPIYKHPPTINPACVKSVGDSSFHEQTKNTYGSRHGRTRAAVSRATADVADVRSLNLIE